MVPSDSFPPSDGTTATHPAPMTATTRHPVYGYHRWSTHGRGQAVVCHCDRPNPDIIGECQNRRCHRLVILVCAACLEEIIAGPGRYHVDDDLYPYHPWCWKAD